MKGMRQRDGRMFVWLWLSSVVAVTGSRIFESEMIQRVFRQEASFCFRPFQAEGCDNGTVLWEEGGETSSVPPKTMAFLFTPANPNHPEFLHTCAGRLPRNTHFNPRHKTEILVHGFLDGACRSAWMREVKEELLRRGPHNVILLDWTWGNGPDYNASTGNTGVVGRQLALLLRNIMDQSGAGPENFHLIGHSLGAHVAGFAGKRVKHLRRITALDPALTPFQNLSREERLDSSDANLVDVIHTNGGMQPGKALGDILPLGHADFYPNGGTTQESCRRHIVTSYLRLDFLYATISLVPRICSHMHAVQYYKASINPKGCEFVGVECPDYESFQAGQCSVCRKDGSNCAVMGMDHERFYLASNRTGGSHPWRPRKFYLNTTLQYPYCDNSGIGFEESEVSSSI